MEVTAAVALVGAVVAPFVVALIVRPTWSPDAKRNTAIGVSVVLGLVVALATGKIEGVPDIVEAWVARVLVAVAVVTSLAQGFYLTLKGVLDKLAAATSPTPAEQSSSN